MFTSILKACSALSIASKVSEIAENITDSVGLHSVSEVLGNIKDTADNLQVYCPINIIKEKFFDD
ncbi:MAG: hypothetical protein COW71_06435 [Ignavibacteriales bacterium CG18_big_fil_WC_8_21_14_2_50_31_20]|nr:MAG: hypothetical protein COW71_06435 [Ignavibacteriales bacterium CG18_big_fil_WC_8_21_14_2_50_31_20]